MTATVLNTGGLSQPECWIVCSECKDIIYSRDSLAVRFDALGKFVRGHVCVTCFGEVTKPEVETKPKPTKPAHTRDGRRSPDASERPAPAQVPPKPRRALRR